MKIRLHSRNAGSGFICVFLALVVITIGGCATYHIRKWSQRIPVTTPPTPPPASCSNDTSNVSAPGTGTVQLVRLSHYWVQGDSEAEALPVEPAAPARSPGIIRVSLTNSLLVLSVTNDVGWVNVDLSPYVDSTGFPLRWDASPAGEAVEVYRSFDLSEWVYFMTVFVSEGTPAIVRDTDVKPMAFYLAKFRGW